MELDYGGLRISDFKMRKSQLQLGTRPQGGRPKDKLHFTSRNSKMAFLKRNSMLYALCSMLDFDLIDTIVRKRYCKIHSTKAYGQQRISTHGVRVANPLSHFH
jgi:hypothetical protein